LFLQSFTQLPASLHHRLVVVSRPAESAANVNARRRWADRGGTQSTGFRVIVPPSPLAASLRSSQHPAGGEAFVNDKTTKKQTNEKINNELLTITMTKLDSIKIRNAVLKLKKSKPVNVGKCVFVN